MKPACECGYKWLVAVCGMCLNALQSSYFAVFGVLYLELVHHFSTSKAVISWVGATMQFVYGLSGLVYGPLIRRYGVRGVVMVAPLVVSLGCICTAFTSHLWTLFITLGLMTGCGLSGYGNIAVSAVYQWFPKGYTQPISLVMLGVPLGAFIWPPVVTWLIDLYAWKGALLIVAGLQLNALVLIALLRPPKGGTLSNDTQDTQMRRYEDTNYIGDDKGSATASTKTKHHDEPAEQSKQLCGWFILFRNPSFPIFFLGIFLMFSGNIVTYGYTTARGILVGHSQVRAAMLASLLGASGVAGRGLAGLLSSWIGRSRRMYVCALSLGVTGLVTMLSSLSEEFWVLAAYSVVWGIVSGCYMVYTLSGSVDLFGRQYAPEMTGFNLACGGVSFLCTNVITGVMLDTTGDPSLPFTVFGGVQCVAAAALLLATCLRYYQLSNSSNKESA